MMHVSLVITTYNWPEALSLCLESAARQTLLPAEVMVADDGSDERTKAVVDRFRERVSFPVKHIWQENRGYRLAVVCNRALAICQGNYVVQVEGDAVLHRRFLEDHAAAAAEGYFVSGVRACMEERLMRKVLETGSEAGVSWYVSGVRQRAKAYRAVWLSRLMCRYGTDSFRCGSGCNLAFWRDDLWCANGYDESLEGWGREKEDLTHRLMRLGIRKRTLRFAGIMYRLWCPVQQEAPSFARNDLRPLLPISHGPAVCRNGTCKPEAVAPLRVLKSLS